MQNRKWINVGLAVLAFSSLSTRPAAGKELLVSPPTMNDFGREAIEFWHGPEEAQNFADSGVEVVWGKVDDAAGESRPGLIVLDKNLKGRAPRKWIAQVIAHEWAHHVNGHVDIPLGSPVYDWPLANCVEWGVHCGMYGHALTMMNSGDCDDPNASDLCPDCQMLGWLKKNVLAHGHECHGYPFSNEAIIDMCPNSSAGQTNPCD